MLCKPEARGKKTSTFDLGTSSELFPLIWPTSPTVLFPSVARTTLIHHVGTSGKRSDSAGKWENGSVSLNQGPSFFIGRAGAGGGRLRCDGHGPDLPQSPPVSAYPILLVSPSWEPFLANRPKASPSSDSIFSHFGVLWHFFFLVQTCLRKVASFRSKPPLCGGTLSALGLRTGQDYGDNLYRFAMLSLAALEAPNAADGLTGCELCVGLPGWVWPNFPHTQGNHIGHLPKANPPVRCMLAMISHGPSRVSSIFGSFGN